MDSKNTILTQKKLTNLEAIIALSGDITTTKEIYQALGKDYTKLGVKKMIMKLKEAGWLIPIKRGIYAIADISSREFVSLSPLVIANTLNKDSYISFESALNYYGLFEQMVKTTISITTGKSCLYHFQGFDYRFRKIKKGLYFGFKQILVEGHYINVADLEKTILDYLYFRKDAYTIDLLLEKLAKAKQEIDFDKLIKYAKKFPTTTNRKLGFLLDLLNINTEKLLDVVSKKGYSRLTKNSNVFSAKWRLYYERRFNRTEST